MAITTMTDALKKCTQPVEHVRSWSNMGAGTLLRHTWTESGGWHGANLIPVTGMSGTVLTASHDTYFRYTNPPAGQKKYLCKLSGMMNALSGTIAAPSSGSWLLFDRLWHSSGIVVTDLAAQAVNSPAWPRFTDGAGVWLGMETRTALGALVTNITVNYTNSDGVAGRTGVIDMTLANTLQPGAIHLMKGDNGDLGVRSVQSMMNGSSLVSGTAGLVAMYPLVFAYTAGGKVDRRYLGPLDLGFPEFPDGCCPMVGSNGNGFSMIISEWTFAEG